MSNYSDQASRTSSTQATALRPRPSRLISGLEEFAAEEQSGEGSLISPYQSRAASPIPSKHPSRSSSARPVRRENSNLGPNDLAASLSGLWGKSWTSIQGIASNVLGSDISNETYKDKTATQRRQLADGAATRSASSPVKWGPSNPTLQPGAGSLAERKAMVRAQKRKELLMANGSTLLDASTARLKRRTSDEFESNSTPPGAHDDREALVYIHHVAPNETLAGISIKFNCQLATIKRANRLWSNDNIQARKTLMIPVDSCSIKGRRVAGPGEDAEDLLALDSLAEKEPAQALPTSAPRNLDQFPSLTTNDNQSTISTIKEEPLWQHDSWVQIENFTSAIEIARLPRRELGYFPRTRRKSISLSDLDTPSASFDLGSRPAINVTSETSPGASKHRPRKSSDTTGFRQQMNGPGGVGTLGGRGPSAPGPAEDKLNKVISKHLPNLIPKTSDTPRSIFVDEYDAQPHYTSSGFENVGGILEGWVRKVARNAAKAMESTGSTSGSGSGSGSQLYYTPSGLSTHAVEPRSHGRVSSGGKGANKTISATGTGDLIELTDAFEIGEDEDEADDRTPTAENHERRGRSLASSGWNGRAGRASTSGFSSMGESGKKKGE